MAVDFVPLHDRILARRVEEEETTRGGIVIPDTAKEKPQEGEVLAVGTGKIADGKVLTLDVKRGIASCSEDMRVPKSFLKTMNMSLCAKTRY